jgi:hypothetical protein
VNYRNYEKELLQQPIVHKGMRPWMGTYNVKQFIKYMFDEGYSISSVLSSFSTYKDGYGIMDVSGKCQKDAEDYEFTAHFLSQGSYAEALLDVDEDAFEAVDTYRSHAWLDSVDVNYVN